MPPRNTPAPTAWAVPDEERNRFSLLTVSEQRSPGRHEPRLHLPFNFGGQAFPVANRWARVPASRLARSRSGPPGSVIKWLMTALGSSGLFSRREKQGTPATRESFNKNIALLQTFIGSSAGPGGFQIAAALDCYPVSSQDETGLWFHGMCPRLSS